MDPDTVADEEYIDLNNKEDDFPKDYIFLSYFAFVLWSPLSDTKDRLSLLFTDDTHKSISDGGRAQKRNSD